MNHKNTRTSQAGFSLVELMVVVAIIGVLAAIAIPNINKYIAKSRQSEAKTNLSALYTTEKAFYAEYTGYFGIFQAVGYSPEGKLRYNLGFTAAGGQPAGYTGSVAGQTSTLAYCGQGTAVGANGCIVLAGNGIVVPNAVPGTAVISNAGGVSTFTAAATSMLIKSVPDTWTIDQNKVVTNTANGIN